MLLGSYSVYRCILRPQRKEAVLRKARKQNGSLYLDVNGSKIPVWMFSWQHILPTGQRVRRKRQVGTLDQYKTEAAAERAVRSWRLAINSNEVHAFSGITVKDLIEHFRLKELDRQGEHGRPGRHAKPVRELPQPVDRA